MTREFAELLFEAARDLGVETEIFYPDYSGRMIGHKTYAVVFPDRDWGEVFFHAGVRYSEEGSSFPVPSTLRSDQLGLGWVVY